MLIFLHIPKTAGSTLNHVLKHQYRERGSVHDSYAWDPREAVRPFLKLPHEAQQAVKIFKGHFHFGVHEYLPQPSTYFTVLRDPIERVISHYYYIRREPSHFGHAAIVSRKMSLEDYVASGLFPESDNGQTRFLAGPLGLHDRTLFGRCGEELLQAAEANMGEHFSVVGIQEEFDSTLLLLQDAYGWRTPYYVCRNVTRERPRLAEVPQETLDVIHAYNQIDLRLYAQATLRFRAEVARRGPDFAAERERLQAANRCYTWSHQLIEMAGWSAGRAVKKLLNKAPGL